MFFSSTGAGTIDRVIKDHTHAPEELELFAQIVERNVIDELAATCSTQHIRPNHVSAKILTTISKSKFADASVYVRSKEAQRSAMRR